ncbi:hypothetical protein SCLCIDRAFT_26240 [Scleroderma citrinum Foug A]|uniref:Uncharacterized protein n=1 Tax=Scleroderma citrinum Foug A TaxID=1036808 RepID=A0A0C3A7P3_9AGAM|nr:hypothetical protein SCLCIDRAFT_26240 [Scleroderma citrinum Foug A]
MPELDDSNNGLPHGSVDLGNGYILLRKRSKNAIIPRGDEAAAISQFLGPGHLLPHIKKWAQLRLPNGQIAHSAWREALRPPEQIRVSRNVKFLNEEVTRCGEVQYFTRLAIADADENTEFADVALVRMYSAPDPELLQHSSHVVLASQLTDTISVICVKQITGVIAMIPQWMTLPSGVEQEMYCMC